MNTQAIIRALRDLGMSQTAIAAECGVSQGAISHIETGRRIDARASTHQKLSDLLRRAKKRRKAPLPKSSTPNQPDVTGQPVYVEGATHG